MRTVYKYPLTIADEQTVNIPGGHSAQLLSVQIQHGTPCLWALVDPSLPCEEVSIRIAGTGHDIDQNVEFIDTFQELGGRCVFHAFKIITQ